MSKSYNEAYKLSVYEQYRAGVSLTRLCKATGITDKTLSSWFKEFDRRFESACTHSLASVHQQCHELNVIQREKERELSFFQEYSILERIPEHLRISCAEHLIPLYGPNQVCRSLKIRKSNFYYHNFRAPQETAYEKHDRELRPIIRALCKNKAKLPSSESIRQQLMDRGFSVSKRKVLELVHELQSSRKKTAKQNTSVGCQSPDNLLARQFSPPAPNQVWLSDITDIKTDQGPYSLCVILDLFARRVIAARISSKKDTYLVSDTLRDAFLSRGKPAGLLFHSDRGAQYTCREFQAQLADYGITQSLSNPGTPYDNAPMESFFASLKTEETHRFRYAGLTQLTVSIQDYIRFYNHERPHSSAAYLTPIQAEIEYAKKLAAGHDADCLFPYA